MFCIINKDNQIVLGLEHCSAETRSDCLTKLGQAMFLCWGMWSQEVQSSTVMRTMKECGWAVQHVNELKPLR